MMRVTAGGLCALLVLVSPALAQEPPQLYIDIGEILLQPNTSGQKVEFYVTGGADVEVQSLDFYIQVADGGPEAADFFSELVGVVGPAIESIDLETGTIFAPNNDGQMASPDPWPQQQDAGIATKWDDPTPVYAEGLIATVYFDTTNPLLADSPDQPWDLRLDEILDGLAGSDIGTAFMRMDGDSLEKLYPEAPRGTIRIIPEPSAWVMLSLLGLGLLGWWGRASRPAARS